MPWHGCFGVVEVVGKGKPRNHGVRMDAGPMIVIPCGNLKTVDAAEVVR